MARRYRRPDLDNPFWWFGFLFVLAFYVLALAFYVLVLGLWLAWALIALPIAGIAQLSRHDELAGRMIRSLKWASKRPRRR